MITMKRNSLLPRSFVGQMFALTIAFGSTACGTEDVDNDYAHEDNGIAAIALSPSQAALAVDDTLQLNVVITENDGDARAATAGEASFASTNDTIVSVSSSGLATAIAAGEASLSAEIDGVQSNTVSIVVSTEEVPAGGTASGSFTGATGHNVSGQAFLVTEADGTLRLDLGDTFQTTPGPDLSPALSNQPYGDGNELVLADLQASSGGQSYAVPEGVELGDYAYVLIHCVQFNVTFGYAPLSIDD